MHAHLMFAWSIPDCVAASPFVCVQYEVSVVGKLPSGELSPASNTLTFTTPDTGSPIIAAADPQSPTTATVVLNPPATGGPVKEYEVTVCLVSDPTTCVTETCPTTNCPVDGLTPGETYTVTAVAVLPDGTRVPASNEVPLTMPQANAPTLTSAVDTSSTTGTATAAPPPGTTYDQVCVWVGVVVCRKGGWELLRQHF